MFIVLLIFSIFNFYYRSEPINYGFLDSQIDISVSNFKSEHKEYEKYLSKNYFKGEHKDKIAKKINKYLNSTLKGKGDFIVEYSLSVGMDPYLAASVMLQETGCRWTCSKLVRSCNNVGGNKGKPSCNGGSYKKFSTIDEGIKFAINKLNSYYKKGYKTAKEINKYYATDKTWYKKVNKYIKLLKG